MWCLDSFNSALETWLGWVLYGLLYRARGISTDTASRVVSGVTQSLFSGSRKVCDIFVGSGWPCSLNALSSHRSIEVTESPGLRRMPELGSLLLRKYYRCQRCVALSYVSTVFICEILLTFLHFSTIMFKIESGTLESCLDLWPDVKIVLRCPWQIQQLHRDDNMEL